jgi:hypothetical protein
MAERRWKLGECGEDAKDGWRKWSKKYHFWSFNPLKIHLNFEEVSFIQFF